VSTQAPEQTAGTHHHSSGLTPDHIEQRLATQFPGVAITRLTGEAIRDHVLIVPAANLVEICTFLRDDPELQFSMLSWISGVDWLPRDPRFEVVYGLLSMERNARLTLKVMIPEEQAKVPTVCGVWSTANWHEREVFDLSGVRFTGHPDLRRILCPEDWVGYPLRRDYEMPLEYHGIRGR
jgi:NADH-quinone oxidoreductase subunit C